MDTVIVPGTKIAIDASIPDPKNEYTHFLSSVNLESKYDFMIMRDRNIITTKFNKWFLVEFCRFDPDKVFTIEKNETVRIKERETGIVTTVKTIDSNYCVGSVMFLFEGDTGNFLFTGKFRFYDGLLDNPYLQKYYEETATLHALGIQTQWPLDMMPQFPPRYTVLLDVLEFVRCSPLHIIIFVSPPVANEELYVAVSKGLKERIFISNSLQFRILQHQNLGEYFTISMDDTRLWVIDPSELKGVPLDNLDAPCQIVCLSADPIPDTVNVPVYRFPYFNYSSRDELAFFITALRPVTTQVMDEFPIEPGKILNKEKALDKKKHNSLSKNPAENSSRKRKRVNSGSSTKCSATKKISRRCLNPVEEKCPCRKIQKDLNEPEPEAPKVKPSSSNDLPATIGKTEHKSKDQTDTEGQVNGTTFLKPLDSFWDELAGFDVMDLSGPSSSEET